MLLLIHFSTYCDYDVNCILLKYTSEALIKMGIIMLYNCLK